MTCHEASPDTVCDTAAPVMLKTIPAYARPFFQTRKTRREYGDRSKNLPYPEDRHEVQRVAKLHHAFTVFGSLCQFRQTT
jgi:hypothetical protein